MKKILLVDDSDAVRSELKELLSSKGYAVVEGVDGLDGLNQAKNHLDIDLFISDLNMPEMDGIMMCTKIREIEHYKSTPIFMLTTESSLELKNAAKAAGILAWIVKPYTNDRVLGMIEKAFAMVQGSKVT
jgi:two-component system, chemotaxis family, chemotaxis protein CheY